MHIGLIPNAPVWESFATLPPGTELGKRCWVPDRNWASAGAPVTGCPSLSGDTVEYQLVLNDTGSTLNPAELLAWDTAAPLKEVKALADSDHATTLYRAACGVVNPFVSTVATGRYFWMITHGPCKFKNENSTPITTAVGSRLIVSAEAGRVALGSGTVSSADVDGTVGYALAISSTADELFRGFMLRYRGSVI